MAVEAPNMTLFSPQTLSKRDVNMIDQGNGSRYDDRIQTVYGMVPFSGTMAEKLPPPPIYGFGMTESFLKAESGLTCSIPLSRKRSRDSASFNQPFAVPDGNRNQLDRHQIGMFGFLSEDISSQIYQQQMEIDRFIDHHTEKVRKDIDEMRRRNSRRLMAVAEEGIQKKLKAKEDEIMKIGKLNWSLEEKVKSLIVENQIWRELAQTNEATANALRINLQQVLTQAQIQQQNQIEFAENAAKATETALIDGAQSYCGSNNYEEDEGLGLDQHQLQRKVNQINDENEYRTGSISGRSRYGGGNRRCRNCWKKESCVLLLPCRHLCVCTVCASAIGNCPVCKSTKSAVLHVNIT